MMAIVFLVGDGLTLTTGWVWVLERYVSYLRLQMFTKIDDRVAMGCWEGKEQKPILCLTITYQTLVIHL